MQLTVEESWWTFISTILCGQAHAGEGLYLLRKGLVKSEMETKEQHHFSRLLYLTSLSQIWLNLLNLIDIVQLISNDSRDNQQIQQG